MDLMVRELKDDMRQFQERDLIMALYNFPNKKQKRNEEEDQQDSKNILMMLKNPNKPKRKSVE